jgi:hypothetical protein
MVIISILGWVGAGLLLVAYFLLIHKNLTSRSRMYQWMNIIGAVFLGVQTYYIQAWPSFVTNMFWLLVAAYGVFHAVKHHRAMGTRKLRV